MAAFTHIHHRNKDQPFAMTNQSSNRYLLMHGLDKITPLFYDHGHY